MENTGIPTEKGKTERGEGLGHVARETATLGGNPGKKGQGENSRLVATEDNGGGEEKWSPIRNRGDGKGGFGGGGK